MFVCKVVKQVGFDNMFLLVKELLIEHKTFEVVIVAVLDILLDKLTNV